MGLIVWICWASIFSSSSLLAWRLYLRSRLYIDFFCVYYAQSHKKWEESFSDYGISIILTDNVEELVWPCVTEEYIVTGCMRSRRPTVQLHTPAKSEGVSTCTKICVSSLSLERDWVVKRVLPVLRNSAFFHRSVWCRFEWLAGHRCEYKREWQFISVG